METQLENLPDSQVKATVTVDASDVDSRIGQTYRDYARKYNFPGFRKGKAPRPVIDNAFGKESILSAVAEDLVNDTYPLVVESEKLYPVGSPSFDDVGLAQEGQPFTFTFTVSVKPEFELTSYEPLQIELPVEGATDAEIDEQIESLQQHYSTYEDADKNTELNNDNYGDLTIKAVDEDGNDLEALESESRLYQPGSGMFSDAFDDEIRGMKQGQTKEFTLEVPQDEASVLLSDQAGKKVDFTVTCNVVRNKVLPEVNDEWAKETMGANDVADLREQVGETLAAQKAEIMPQLKESACNTELLKRFEGEIPESMAEEAEQNLLQDFFTQLQRQGMNFDTYLMQNNLTSDQFKEDVKLQALDEAKQQLALDAWARHKGIVASDEDVSEEFVKAGLEDPAATEEEWRRNGRLYLIREGIERAKASEDILDTAEVTEVDYAAIARDKKQSGEESEQTGESEESGKSSSTAADGGKGAKSTKKETTKKEPAKKSTAKKDTAKKETTKKTGAKKSDSKDQKPKDEKTKKSTKSTSKNSPSSKSAKTGNTAGKTTKKSAKKADSE